MIKNKACLLLALLPLFVFGQKIKTAKKQHKNNLITIDLYEAYDNRNEHPLSLIAESIEYIPLETNDNCLISKVSSVAMTSNDIFVFVFEDICYRFNKKGKFLNTIGKKGKGPGECERSRNIAVDKVNEVIYMLDLNHIHKYDFAGNHLESFKPKASSYLGLNFKLINTGLLVIGNTSYSYAKPGKRFSYNIFSEPHKKYISRIRCEKNDKIPFCICVPSMYNYNANTYVSDFWSDTIYKIKDAYNLEAYARFELGKFKYRSTEDRSILSNKKNKNESSIIEIRKIEESDKFMFISTNVGLFIHDKKKEITHCTKFFQQNEEWLNFHNDITPFPIKAFIKTPSIIQNNIMIAHNDAIEFLEDDIDINKLPDPLKSLKMDDNPVIVLIKLK